jgi:tetratricopeptide (TPR) repeat protein
MRHYRPPRLRPYLLLCPLLLVAWISVGQSALALSGRPLEKPAVMPRSAKTDTAKADAAARESLIARFLGELSPLETHLFTEAAMPAVVAGHPGKAPAQSKISFCARRESADPAESPSEVSVGRLLRVTLVASGVDDADTLCHYEGQLAALVDELQASGNLDGSPRQQAEAIFEFLHHRILYGGYRIECTDLRMALDHGWFNCVSASVLFNCLAESCGLSVCGLEAPGHAMSRLLLPEGMIDVETTCPKWFRLMSDPKRQAEHVEKTLGQAATKDRTAAREVSAVEMAAMIYYNRGVDLLAAKQFAGAAAANAKALRLDPTSNTAWGNLLATVNNWAIDLSNNERYTEAAELLRQGMAADRTFETFALNYAHVCHQWTVHLCNAGQYEDGLEVLARGAAEQPEVAYFRQAPVDICRRWAHALFDANKPDRALAVFDEAQHRYGASREVLEAELLEVNHWGQHLLQQERFAAAVAAFDRGLTRQPEAALLREGRRAALARWGETEFADQHDVATGSQTAATADPVGTGSERDRLSFAAHNWAPSPAYFQWLLKLQAAGRRAEGE